MLEIKVNEQSEYTIDIQGGKLSLNGNSIDWDVIKISDKEFNIIKDNKSYNVEILKTENKSYSLLINGNEYAVGLRNDLDLLLDKMGISTAANTIENELKAPMPGLVLDVKVEIGQEVKEGDPLIVLVAMKMENVLKSPADVVIKSINVEKDNNVEKNQVLIEFE